MICVQIEMESNFQPLLRSTVFRFRSAHTWKSWKPLQGPRIDFQSEGAKIALYLVFPGGASMLGVGGGIFVL